MSVEINTIINGKKVLEKIINQTIDKDTLADEYNRLLKSYKRLSKRYDKTNKMNDRGQRDSLNQNESLKVDKQNIQIVAKNKIMNSIKLTREVKEQYNQKISSDKQMIEKLEGKLKEVSEDYYLSLKKIEKLTKPKIKYKDDLTIKELYHRNINLEKYKTFTYEQLLDKEIHDANKNKKTFVAIKLTIDGLIDSFKEEGETSTNILNAILKSINGSLKTQDVIYFVYPNIFYILLLNKDIKESQSMLNIIMKPRQINKMHILFSLGITQFIINNDTHNTIENRLDIANKEASIQRSENSLVVQLS